MTEPPSEPRQKGVRLNSWFRDPDMGSRMLAARKAQNMSRQELARRTGSVPRTILMWETNGFTSREQLKAVAKALSLMPADLLNELPKDAILAPAVLTILYAARKKLSEATGLPVAKIRLTFGEDDQ